MRFKKQGFPAEGEIVLCTVKRIQKTTVFVELDEYQNNREGIIHISEISPGRIRTILDFVKEGKKIVCKVLRRNERYGNLDLSLRRVTTGQKLNKLKDLKLEDKSEKIIEAVCKQLKLDFNKVYDEVSNKLLKQYESVGLAFQAIAENEELSLADSDVDKKTADALEILIKSRLKPQEIILTKTVLLSSPNPDGIDAIKKSLKKAIELAEKKKYDLKLLYISAPRYSLTITTANPKEADAQTEELLNTIKESIEKDKGTFDVEKAKK